MLTYSARRKTSKIWLASFNSKQASQTVAKYLVVEARATLSHSSSSSSSVRTVNWNLRVRWRTARLRSSKRISRWASQERTTMKSWRCRRNACDSEQCWSSHLCRMMSFFSISARKTTTWWAAVVFRKTRHVSRKLFMSKRTFWIKKERRRTTSMWPWWEAKKKRNAW